MKTLITAFLALYVCSSAYADQTLNSLFTKQELQSIRLVIKQATSDPILSLDIVYTTDKNVPNSVLDGAWTRYSGDGQKKRIPRYARTDQISVTTGYESNLTGGSYLLQMDQKRWMIVSKSFWIQ